MFEYIAPRTQRPHVCTAIINAQESRANERVPSSSPNCALHKTTTTAAACNNKMWCCKTKHHVKMDSLTRLVAVLALAILLDLQPSREDGLGRRRVRRMRAAKARTHHHRHHRDRHHPCHLQTFFSKRTTKHPKSSHTNSSLNFCSVLFLSS